LKTKEQPDRVKYVCIALSRTWILPLLILAIRMTAVSADLEDPAAEKPMVPDTLRIGLQEAILMGLENNPTVMIQRLEPEMMRTAVKENSAAFDPVLDVTAEKSESKSQRRLGAQRTPFNLQDNRFDMGAQISEFLPTGTTISVTAGMTGSVSNLYTDQYTGSAGLNVTQSLLKGFGFCANLAGYRQARLDLEISRSELKGIAESVTADIEKAYWDLYLTRQETGIQQKSLALAEQQLAESLERVAVGKLPELELAAVHAEVAARHGLLIDALSHYEQARLHFLYLINPRIETFWETIPAPADRPFMPADTLDEITIHEQIGIKLRPDLEQARLQLKKGELEVAHTRNGLLPQLDVFLSLGRTTYSEVFREAYPDLKSPFYQANAGVTFSFPVPDREASAQWQRARYSRDQQRLAVLNMEKLVQWDIRSAYVEVLRARQQIEATHVTREMQEKKLAAELEKFRVGKSTNYLVLQAQRDFTASQLDEARAMVAYLNALVDLYVSEGSLLERRGVESLDDPSIK
jgi:outer membrane protein